MRGYLALVVLLVAVVAGFAVYSNTHQEIPTPDTSIPHIVPDTSTIEYRDTALRFSIQYPDIATSSPVEFAGYLPRTASPVASFTLPRSMFEGTNLGEAGVYIGATTSPKIVASCETPMPDMGELSVSSTTLNGAVFATATSSDAGAGNRYETTVFRAVHDGTCFEIVELLHWADIHNFGPETAEFDKAKFQGYLDAIAATFSFIQQ